MYLDKSIVSNIIAFESKWQAMKDMGREAVLEMVKPETKLFDEIDDSYETSAGEKLSRLDIGEIRASGKNNYFVWVRESSPSDGSRERIYRINAKNETMIFEGYTEI